MSAIARQQETMATASRVRRVLIVNNPAAGRPAAHRAVTRLAQRLRQLQWQVDVAGTDYQGHATELTAQAVSQGFALVVAAGGDGTINEVIQSLAGSPTALGVLPVGTANVWAADTGIPADPDALAALLDRGAASSIDVGRAGSRYFLLMAGVGFDAAVVQGLQPDLKRRVGRWAYAVTAANLARHYAGTSMRLRLDGVELRHTVLMLVIGNTRRYAGSFRLTPNAMVDDGRLDVCIVPGSRLLRSPAQTGAVLTGAPLLRRALHCRQAASIEIDAAQPLPVQLDGDFAGWTPLHVEAVPGALRVVVPKQRANGLFRYQLAEERRSSVCG
ncbi:MAG TPA: diacylglycerol kinase family protein [Chloroflexota bacterium]|nr:diacylglycerol kinase family protein [Chloroflexota bacterium]